MGKARGTGVRVRGGSVGAGLLAAAMAQGCGGDLGVAPLPGPDAMVIDATAADAGDAPFEPSPPGEAGAAETGTDAGADATDASSPADAGGGASDASDAASDASDAASEAGDAAIPSGILDVTFAGTGYVTATGAAGPAGQHADRATAIAIDPQDRPVVAGWSEGAAAYAAVAWRFTELGAPDATFGIGGVWVSPIATDAGVNGAEAQGLVLDSAGAPRLVGYVGTFSTEDVAVWGLTGSGALDATFGQGGATLAAVPAKTSATFGYGAARDASGRIFATGVLFQVAPADAGTGPQPTDGATWCFGAAGSPDTTFASPAGYVVTASTGGTVPSEEEGSAVAVDPSGAVVVAGYASEPGYSDNVAIWRFGSDGTPDATFGTSGHVLLPRIVDPGATSGTDYATSVTTDAQRRVVFAGYGVDATDVMRGFVGRLDATGALDATFGTAGIVRLDAPPSTATHSWATAVALDSLGRIVAAGERSDATGAYVAVWRLTAAGAFDTTFGVQGLFTMTSTAGGQGSQAADEAWGLAIDAQNRPVIAGQSSSPTALNMAVWRLTP
jgi:uncharacterized delta-60 repeat protein